MVGAKPAMSDSERAPTARPVSLWAWVAYATWCSRISAFGSPIGRRCRCGATWLPSEVGSPSSSVTLIGTSAVSELPRADRLAAGQQPGPQPAGDHRQDDVVDGVRRAPPGPPSDRPAAPDTVANRRCSDTSPASGELHGGRGPRSASPASSPSAPPTPPTASPTATATPERAGQRAAHVLHRQRRILRALPDRARPAAPAADGSGSGCQAVGVASRPAAVRLVTASSSTWPMSTRVDAVDQAQVRLG